MNSKEASEIGEKVLELLKQANLTSRQLRLMLDMRPRDMNQVIAFLLKRNRIDEAGVFKQKSKSGRKTFEKSIWKLKER